MSVITDQDVYDVKKANEELQLIVLNFFQVRTISNETVVVMKEAL